MYLMECSVLIDLKTIACIFERMNVTNRCMSDRGFAMMKEYRIIRSDLIVPNKVVLYDSFVVFGFLLFSLNEL